MNCTDKWIGEVRRDAVKESERKTEARRGEEKEKERRKRGEGEEKERRRRGEERRGEGEC